MDPSSSAYPQSQAKPRLEIRSAATLLLVASIALIAVAAYFYFTAESRLNAEIERSIGTPLAELRQMPEEMWSVMEEERQAVLKKRHAAFGAILGTGGLLFLMGLGLPRAPRLLSIVGLLVLGLGAVAFGFLVRRPATEPGDEPVAPELQSEKWIIWAAVAVAMLALLWALVQAIRLQRRIARVSLQEV
jgi:hypothetical protein